MEELIEFIQANPDSRELKRALAIKMVMENYTLTTIGNVLGVSLSFISKWKYVFAEQGIAGIKLKYKGSRGYLDEIQTQAVISWLKQKNYWHLEELKAYIEENFNVVFASNQSYYELFSQANISWKKTQKKNPRKDPDLVTKKN